VQALSKGMQFVNDYWAVWRTPLITSLIMNEAQLASSKTMSGTSITFISTRASTNEFFR